MKSTIDSALASYTKVSVLAGKVTDFDSLLHVISVEAAALVGVERCSIHLRDDAVGVFRGYAGQCGGGKLGEDIKRSLAGVPADRVTRELLKTRRPVIVANARSDSRIPPATVRYWNIASIMAVPMTFDDKVIGVLFLDDPGAPRRFTEEEAERALAFGSFAAGAVAQARAQLDLRSRLDAACRHVRALRRAGTVDEQLSQLALDGASLQELTSALARVLANPCALFSPEGEQLAAAAPAEESERSGANLSILQRDFATRPEMRGALASNEESGAFVVGPAPHAGLMHRYAVAPVILRDELWGRLVVMEHTTRFTGADAVALRRAATLIALHVSVGRADLAAEDDEASLVAELVAGADEPRALQRRADRLGISLSVPRAVMLLAPRAGFGEPGPEPEVLAGAFEEAAPGIRFKLAMTADGTAALLDLQAPADRASFVAEALPALRSVHQRLPGSDHIVAGVSAVHGDLDGYRAGYGEAAQVVECIRRFSPAGGPAIFSSEDLGVGRICLSTGDSAVMSALAEDTVGSLLRDPTGMSLLTTLWSFFEHLESIRETAEDLGVHENTIRHRLTRLEELTGLAVAHVPDAQMRARLSLLVLLLQGRLVPEDAAPAPADEDSIELSGVAAN